MAKTVNDINLLPNKGEGLVTQFLSWALSIGRLLIILTETLALGTFVYRFGLDMKIVDLHDQIKSDSIILQNFKSSEDTFRDLQTRLTLAKHYTKSSGITPTVLNDIISMGRGNVTFQNLLVSQGSVKIQVQTPTTSGLSNFITALKQYPNLDDVTIDKVENQTSSSLISVAITAKLRINPNGNNANILQQKSL